MDKKTTAHIGVIIASLLALFGLYLLWQKSLPGVAQNPHVVGSISPAVNSAKTVIENDPGTSNNKFADDSQTLRQNFKKFEEIIKPFTQPFVTASPTLTPNVSKSAPKDEKIWTKQELFDWTWSPEYRKQIVKIQEIMIQEGFMRELEKDVMLNSDASIYVALEKIFVYARNKGWIVAEDFPKLQEGLRLLPDRIAYDRKVLLNSDPAPIVLPGKQTFKSKSEEKKSLVKNIIDGFKYAVSIPVVEAQIPGVAGWHTGSDCYKDIAPSYPPQGPNLVNFCCNCGLFCTVTPPSCTFVPDCGPFSLLCNVPLGCLNFSCAAWPNAIWDGNGTRICGCG